MKYPSPHPIDAIVFDLDGTLWDSCDSVLLAWNQGIDSWNQTQSKMSKDKLLHLKIADVRDIMGLSFKEIFNQLFPEQEPKVQSEIGLYLEKFEAEVLSSQGGIIYPFVSEIILKLQKSFPIGIVSNCQVGYIENFLNHHPEFEIKGFRSHGATGLNKSENIIHLCHENQWGNIIYLGDTISDYQACHSVNISGEDVWVDFHLANWGFGSSKVLDLNPNQVNFNNFKEWWEFNQVNFCLKSTSK